MKTTAEAGLPPVPGGETLLTKKQLAQYLGKSERTIDNWRKQVGLPCIKINHSVFFRLSDVMRHIERYNGRLVPVPDRAATPVPAESEVASPVI